MKIKEAATAIETGLAAKGMTTYLEGLVAHFDKNIQASNNPPCAALVVLHESQDLKTRQVALVWLNRAGMGDLEV